MSAVSAVWKGVPIDHSPGGHNDVANAVAGALVRAFELRGTNEDFYRRRPPPPVRIESVTEYREATHGVDGALRLVLFVWAGAHHLVVITEERQVGYPRGTFLRNFGEIGTSRHDHIITPPYPLRSKRDFQNVQTALVEDPLCKIAGRRRCAGRVAAPAS
jgi:hypothetical protein